MWEVFPAIALNLIKRTLGVYGLVSNSLSEK